jgi:hypothetical protein
MIHRWLALYSLGTEGKVKDICLTANKLYVIACAVLQDLNQLFAALSNTSNRNSDDRVF